MDFDGDGQIDSQTRFAYDGNQIVLQFDRAAAPTGDPADPLTLENLSHRYLWNPAAVDQLMADEQVTDPAVAGDIVWPLGDHQCTIRDLAVYDSSTDTTTVVNHRTFDAYGNLQSQTNAAIDCLFAYTGRPLDQATDLQNNLHRWYDPAVGRWMSEDPIGFEGGETSTSIYIGNSPVVAVDPTGTGEESSEAKRIAASHWTEIDTDLWRAEEGATFEELVILVNEKLAPSRNAMCIQPVTSGVDEAIVHAMCEAWGDVTEKGVVPNPAVGGVYDTTALRAAKTSSLSWTASVGVDTNNFIPTASRHLNAQYYKTAPELAEAIRRATYTGMWPIKELIIIGHSHEGADWIGGTVGGNHTSHFSVGSLLRAAEAYLDREISSDGKPLAYWPTFAEAVAGKLPPVAWLSGEATVYLVGCSTSAFAQTLAEEWLRSSGASVWGTLRPVFGAANGMAWGTEDGRYHDATLPTATKFEDFIKAQQTQTITIILKRQPMKVARGGITYRDLVFTTKGTLTLWEQFFGPTK